MEKLLQWLSENYGLIEPTQEKLEKIIRADPQIMDKIPGDLKGSFVQLLIDKANVDWDIEFHPERSPEYIQAQSYGNFDGITDVVIAETSVGKAYHGHYVRANAELASGKEVNSAHMEDDPDQMSNPYYRIIYTHAPVVHDSSQGGFTYTTNQLSDFGFEDVVSSNTFYSEATGNDGSNPIDWERSYMVPADHDPNTCLQSRSSGAQLFYGTSASFGAAYKGEQNIQLAQYSSINSPIAVVQEPTGSFDHGEYKSFEEYLGVIEDKFGRKIDENSPTMAGLRVQHEFEYGTKDQEGFNTSPERGTSHTAPVAAGWVARAKHDYPDLSNQLIKYAIVSSADPVLTREKQENDLLYVRNKAGNLFNIGAGAGLLTEETFMGRVELLADLLASNEITSTPVQHTYALQKLSPSDHPKGQQYANENVYSIDVPDDFSAVTIQLTGQFGASSGPLILISPEGTEFPLAYNDTPPPGKAYVFSAKSEAWAGEHTMGQWFICMPENVEITEPKITLKGDSGNIVDQVIASTMPATLEEKHIYDLGDRQVLTTFVDHSPPVFELPSMDSFKKSSSEKSNEFKENMPRGGVGENRPSLFSGNKVEVLKKE